MLYFVCCEKNVFEFVSRKRERESEGKKEQSTYVPCVVPFEPEQLLQAAIVAVQDAPQLGPGDAVLRCRTGGRIRCGR